MNCFEVKLNGERFPHRIKWLIFELSEPLKKRIQPPVEAAEQEKPTSVVEPEPAAPAKDGKIPQNPEKSVNIFYIGKYILITFSRLISLLVSKKKVCLSREFLFKMRFEYSQCLKFKPNVSQSIPQAMRDKLIDHNISVTITDKRTRSVVRASSASSIRSKAASLYIWGIYSCKTIVYHDSVKRIHSHNYQSN